MTDSMHIYRDGRHIGVFVGSKADAEAQGYDVGDAPQIVVTEAMVRAEAGRRVEMLVAEALPCTGATWPMQVPEAEAYQADQTAPTPFLAARAAGCALTVAELAATVIAKRDALAAATGAIYGAMDVLLAMDPIPANFADDSHWP